MSNQDAKTEAPAGETNATEQKGTRRKIPGNMSYTGSPGVLKRTLERIPLSEKPAVFTTDFLSTVLGASGGAARPVIPILKATGLLSQSGAPTELYAQFQTEGGRSTAALQALKNGYAEIFKRNLYAHRADEKALIDSIVSITGLPKNDKIVRSILNTFQTFQVFATSAVDQPAKQNQEKQAANEPEGGEPDARSPQASEIGLIYNINVVLPETTNIEVYNAIFRSLKANMLR